MPITVSGTSITFNDSTTQTTAGAPGTVTSIATGNGLSGGTITSTGTLIVACPTFNTVGSYCFVCNLSGNGSTFTSGSNYSAGSGNGQLSSCGMIGNGFSEGTTYTPNTTNNLSGTWKWMSGTIAYNNAGTFGLACRVS
jgi:hypothetical protein